MERAADWKCEHETNDPSRRPQTGIWILCLSMFDDVHRPSTMFIENHVFIYGNRVGMTQEGSRMYFKVMLVLETLPERKCWAPKGPKLISFIVGNPKCSVFVKNSLSGSLIWRSILYNMFIRIVWTIFVFGQNLFWYKLPSSVHCLGKRTKNTKHTVWYYRKKKLIIFLEVYSEKPLYVRRHPAWGFCFWKTNISGGLGHAHFWKESIGDICCYIWTILREFGYVNGTWMVRGWFVDSTWMVRGFDPKSEKEGPMRVILTIHQCEAYLLHRLYICQESLQQMDTLL